MRVKTGNIRKEPMTLNNKQARKPSSEAYPANSPMTRFINMQRAVGNQAVAKIFEAGGLQGEFEKCLPGDACEREDGRLSDGIKNVTDFQPSGECATADQNQAARREKAEEAAPIPNRLDVNLRSIKGGGECLSQRDRAFFERRFGFDFGGVRVHTNERAALLARGLAARAFTVGSDIVFAAGQYRPETPSGRRLLAHELAHVAQQHEDDGFAPSPGGPNVYLQRDETEPFPAAALIAPTADVFDEPEERAVLEDVLTANDVITQIIEKRKVESTWWYSIRYKKGTAEKTGWVPSDKISELASPAAFQFITPGAVGAGSPFQKLREAVADEKLEPKIARLINFMNIVVLPMPSLTLPRFVFESFYSALVAAKGNFKQASLLMTAAVRAFKPTSPGNYPWVQIKTTPASGFDPATFRDKIWHFFWNAYEIFDDTSAAWLDFLGVMYELKSRSEPVAKLFSLEPLSRDAQEDIVFNRGGIAFAQWIMKNEKAVIAFHYGEIEKDFRQAIESDPEMKDLPDLVKSYLVTKALQDPAVTIELKKRCYTDFADYASRYIELVLDAIKKIP